MRSIRAVGASALAAALIALAPAPATASPASVAALQAALTAKGLYGGYVDGIKGPLTRHAVLAFQRRRDLQVDGIAGPRTRRALGWRGRPGLGSRVMRFGNRGWDVAALQFLLQRAGHGPGRADGIFGPLTKAAVLRAQGAAGIAVDGLAGPETIGSLRGGTTESPSGPVRFLRPVPGPIGSPFGRAQPVAWRVRSRSAAARSATAARPPAQTGSPANASVGRARGRPAPALLQAPGP
jgi:hypothetical protein